MGDPQIGTESTASEEVVESPATEISDQPTEETTTEEGASQVEESTESTESDATPELPSKQAKTYSKEIMDHYVKNYDLSPEDFAIPKWQNVIKSKIDADIFIAELNERLKGLEESSKPEPKAVEEPKPVTEEPTKAATPEQRQAYIQQLGQVTKQLNDPEMVKYFGEELKKAEGPEELIGVLSTAMLSFQNSTVPKMIDYQVRNTIMDILEDVLPGLPKMHESAYLGNAWDGLRADSKYQGLPEYGSKEFTAAYDAIVKDNPEIKEMTFKGTKVQQEVARQKFAAKLMMGGKPTPEEAKKLVEVGANKATKAQAKVVATKSLGAGKSKGAFQSSGDDSFKNAILEYQRAQKLS